MPGGNGALPTQRILLISLALFAINALICWPLFGVEYLNDFQSNETSFITFASYLLRYWPHVAWFSWFNAGMPFEDTYLPLVPAVVAVAARVTHVSPAHVFHFFSALAYSLAPVFFFLFARALSGSLAASAGGALLWSLLSPSVVFPQLLNDMGTPWGIRRLHSIVVYGETPHNVAMCLLPVSLWLTKRFLDRPTARRFAVAALTAAAVMLTNAFGIVAVSIASLILYAVAGKYSGQGLASICGILLAAYLAICRLLPPTLIRLLETNSQLVSGDYRVSFSAAIAGGGLLAFLIALWVVLRRFSSSPYCSPMIQFAALFSACFGGITWLGFHDVNLLPQPVRYHVEMEVGVCLLAAFLIQPLARQLRRRMLAAYALVCIVALGWVAVKDYRFARNLIHPADIAHATPIREARWIAANLPGVRVMDAGEGQWLFNIFADNPQMGAGHEPSAPNWMQRVAVYTIYSGTNAGDRDGPISILWLKAFACGAIVVPGANSNDHYHSIAHPDKFDGLLPLVWREAGDSIYRVPLRSTSLAHVIPNSAVVTRRPIHGLDVAPLGPYLAALDDASAPSAGLIWKNPDQGRIVAKMTGSDVISVQITYDPGWQARVAEKAVPLQADALGFMVIDPHCSGECTVDLDFRGGLEREITLAVSLMSAAILLVMLFWRAG